MTNIQELSGMADVEYDFGVSASVASAFAAEVSRLNGQRPSRSSWRNAGLQDFEGLFSRLFRDNGQTQLADLGEISSALNRVKTELARLDQDAREENERRRVAREWAQEQASKGGFEKFLDHIWDFDGDRTPPTAAGQIQDSGPSASVPQPAPASRQPMTGGGGGGGTSSARPSNLRDFASSSRGGDDAFSGSVAKLQGVVGDFAASCSWAKLDASGPISALQQWLTLNEEDAVWADTVAAAFEAAGSEGKVTVSNASLAASLEAAGVPGSRRDIQVNPPMAFGGPPTTGYSNDPVNTATGNFIENESDLVFVGLAEPISLRRTYNSLGDSEGVFGRGWSSWAEAGLELDAEAARLRLPDGRVITFPRMGAGWDRASGENLWLATTDHGFEMSDSAGLRWLFSREGRVQMTGTTEGPEVELIYDEAGRMVGMRHIFGQWIELGYHADSGLVTSARTSDGRTANYCYDQSGQLRSVETAAGIRKYEWNDAGLISAVIDADGVVEAENTYDEHQRVATQLSPFGRLTRFAYLPGGVTEVSDADGTRANTWIADGRGRLIGVIDSDGNRQSTSYDRWGNQVLATQRNGTALATAYDERGRRTRQQMPTGAIMDWTYDELDRVVSVAVSGGDIQPATARYDYAGPARNPSQLTDGEGGITELEWDRGLLRRVVDPTGVAVMLDYDEHGAVVASRNAAGDVARLERDPLGRVVASITPLGNRTEFVYDGEGPLLSRRDPDGAVWRFEHTTGGQLTAVIDPTGGRTESEFGNHGAESRVVDPLGRSAGSTYDDLGNLVRTELPDGTSWEYGWDAMSRLRSVTDASGGQWRADYDVEGMLSATVDPTGVEQLVRRDAAGLPLSIADNQTVTGATYDALGRVVAETGSDGSTVRHVYDRCGRVVELVDGEGGVTRVERDPAGRAVGIVHPLGATVRYEYDACGRRRATVGADGGRYTFDYDADGRLIREVWPTGDEAWVRYDANARPVERFEPGSGLTTVRYDRVGRVVSTRDGWFGLRRFRYDAAGQLVEAVNGVGGVTKFDYDLAGQVVAVEDPSGGRIERSFDPMGRLLSETDALGRTVRFDYDAAGRPTKRLDPTGSQLSWRYDDCGRLSATTDGQAVLARFERDFANRTVRAYEPGHDGQAETVNELVWDVGGGLARRLRSGAASAPETGLAWSYDLEGRRTAFTGPYGDQTRYEYDAAGRVTAVDTAQLGRAVFERDAIGRVCSMSAPGLYAAWTWAAGGVVRLEVAQDGQTQVTEIERDEASRIVAETTDGARTTYEYDGAGQLIEARRGDGAVTTWTYDLGGRLVRETTDGVARDFDYDAAGQLLSEQSPLGETRYDYDAAGRRIREAHGERERRFGWGPGGALASITELDRASDRVIAESKLIVDALGELVDVDGQSVSWDSAGAIPTLAGVGGVSIAGFGPAYGIGSGGSGVEGGDGSVRGRWIAPMRRSRPAGSDPGDPWAVSDAAGGGAGLSAVTVVGSGSLLVGGLEWMQARVYDPSTRGFLSTDPLEPVVGAGWSGNPYSFAGNDPLNQSDPWGLRPVTDRELQGYQDAARGWLPRAAKAANEWWGDNWEYFLAGGLVVGGVVLAATGVGAPAGAAMLATSVGMGLGTGGAALAASKTQGEVDWGKVALSAAVGAIPFGGPTVGFAISKIPAALRAAGGWSGAARKLGPFAAAQATKHKALLTQMGVHGVAGSVANTGTYMATTSDRTLRGAAAAAAGGFVSGAAGGAATPAGGSIAHHKFGRKSNGLVAAGLSGGLGSAGAVGGSVTEDLVAGRPVDLQKATGDALLAQGVGFIPQPFRPPAYTLQQLPSFGVRSMQALAKPGENAIRLYGSAMWENGIEAAPEVLKAKLLE